MENENLLNEMLDMPVFPLYILIPGYLKRLFYWHTCNGEKIDLGANFIVRATTLFEGMQVTSIMGRELLNPTDPLRSERKYFWAAYTEQNLLYLFSPISEENHNLMYGYLPTLNVDSAKIRREV